MISVAFIILVDVDSFEVVVNFVSFFFFDELGMSFRVL